MSQHRFTRDADAKSGIKEMIIDDEAKQVRFRAANGSSEDIERTIIQSGIILNKIMNQEDERTAIDQPRQLTYPVAKTGYLYELFRKCKSSRGAIAIRRAYALIRRLLQRIKRAATKWRW